MPDSTLGPRLRRLRESRGLSAAELARRIGVSRAAVAQFEGGNSVPTWATVQRIADALSVSTDALRG
jgi:transcriptional regulator with XRE-family HTH domain